MSKLVTFTWSATVEVPDDFDEYDKSAHDLALDAAWNCLHRSDGMLTDEQDEDDDE